MTSPFVENAAGAHENATGIDVQSTTKTMP